ncbi:transposase family protein [Streptomyces sp. NPDC018711]|uniref:transposase family protein n=1 Tax=Streptomyces sp. NPDC018711 TaxID=3365052 RepID=UPI0037B6C411
MFDREGSGSCGTVEVVARGRTAGAACPDCGCFSGRVHDRYQRRPKDLPLAEQGSAIRLKVRRFTCGSAGCPRRTFAEPFARLAAPYARFTRRLNHALERVGLALAGRAGAWLAAHLDFGAGRMTLLRRVMTLSDPRSSTSRVLGMDDFAIRWAFKQPGRYLNASKAYSPGIEVEDARDDLERVMLHLPPGVKRDLGRLLTRIDEEFERRALPEPNNIGLAVFGWWWTRMRER